MSHRSRSARSVLVLVVAGLLSAACAAEPASTAGTATAPAATTTAAATPTTPATPTAAPPTAAAAVGPTMTISSFEYEVPPSVRPGAPVTVVNEDREAHTVTIDGGAVRLTVPGGGTAVFTAPSQVGEHPVVCDLHGGMDAVLVVA